MLRKRSSNIENTIESNKTSGENIHNYSGKYGGGSSTYDATEAMLDILEENMEKEISGARKQVTAPPNSSSNLKIAHKSSKQSMLPL